MMRKGMIRKAAAFAMAGCLTAGLTGCSGGSQSGSGGFGIYSIQERLRITYQGRASLSIQATPGQGFRAELRVPRD